MTKAATYKVDYCNENGELVERIGAFRTLEYTKVYGDVGILTLTMPSPKSLVARGSDFWSQLAREDNAARIASFNTTTRAIPGKRLHIYRNGRLDFVGFLQLFEYDTNRDGQELVTLIAYSPEMLLNSRIVAYLPGQAQTLVTGNVETLMKNLVTQNLVDNTDYSGVPDPTRSIVLVVGFSVAADKTLGPVVTPDDMSWRYLLEVLKELQATSKAASDEIFFDVAITSPRSLQFRTYTGQPGVDRSYRGNPGSKVKPLIFSLKNGNLQSPKLGYDFSEMGTKIYAVGQEGTAVATAQDDGKVAYSPLGLRERMLDSRGVTEAEIQASADDELARNRARASLTGRLVSTVECEYGRDWNHGDRVTVEHRGIVSSVIIRAVNVYVSDDGRETITSKIEDIDYGDRTR